MKINYQSSLFHRIYIIGFFVILSLPLLNWPIYFSPPNWAKTVVFQITFSIILFIFLCQLLWQRHTNIFSAVRKINKENLIFWLLLLLFFTNLLATIFSLDIMYSLFGSPYRGGGFINYGFYILFAIVTFLILDNREWQKLWGFSVFIGVLVSILALISRFGILSDIFISRIDNISSTIGGPNTLGLYLVLLVFPALSFGIQEKNKIKKSFYLLSFMLFSLIILLTISQGAYLGFGAGVLYFLIFYPIKNLPAETGKKIFYIKLIFVALMFLAIITVLFIKNNPNLSINENYLFRNTTTWKIDQSRLSTWQVAFNAFLDRPILGYGPENFSIGFDRNYDPSLPQIQMDVDKDSPASWWDKAHNFALNLLVETGILGFISFVLLFGLMFWKLHTISRGKISTEPLNNSSYSNPLIAHGLQTVLIAYFANLIFNFENFSSYILVFLIVGYAMSLTIREKPQQNQKSAKIHTVRQFLFRHKKPVASVIFMFLIGFIWFFNIKPYNVNAQINKAKYLADSKRCSAAIALMEKELKKHSIIDGYLRISYVNILQTCLRAYPENDLTYAQHAIRALQENIKIMPHYTRNWLMMVAFNNMIAVAETDLEKKKAILNQNREYLKKAEVLSPKRHEVLVETMNFALFEENYEFVRKVSEDCTQQYDFSACYWYLGLSQAYLSKDKASLEEGKRNMEKAQAMGYSQLSQYSLTQLAFLYINKNNYQELEWVYERLTKFYPQNPRYFAGLALIYKKNEKLEESTEALKAILRIQADARSIEQGWTESQETIVLLLENILRVKKSSPDYHRALYDLYVQMARDEKDSAKSKIYQQKAEEEYSLLKQ